ncbi:MAG: ATP-binding protein [Oryzomonas sp.]|uniref:ATP-binding protein n=1 Tax=Oryzomonas sp. TaxID=2855186 RepID=UPI00283BBD82|nr:ATP-binding protein [Oryzomonas sp.]MDR3580992.1 ATP-binding protein [Oryzomonas sp.]
MNSISRRLLALLLGALTVAALLAGASTYLKARVEVNELFDYQLLQMALSLRDQKSFEQRPTAASDYEKEDDVTIQVWNSAGALIYVSIHDAPLPRATHAGLQTVIFRNAEWRTFLLTDQGRTIQVSQPFKPRQEMSFIFALRTIMPLFFIFPALALTIWFAVRYTLKPLTKVADGVTRLSPSSLEPLPETNLPAEILPLVQRLNFLFEQLSRAFDIQKRFVADAAHELRTPLTAVKLQVRILERSASEDERIEALERLRLGVDRAARLVGQLLALARVEPEAPPVPLMEVSLNRLAEEIIVEQTRIAAEKGINLGTSADGPVSVVGEPDALRAMISNLVDNAIRYTLPGGTVDVTVRQNELAAIIDVADTGPGIPPEERVRVFDRFYRRQGSDAAGCGLGLAIVKYAVKRHGGTIMLGEAAEGKGLRVIIEIPLHPFNSRHAQGQGSP